MELNEFYKVSYIYQGKLQYAVYFELSSAQNAMMTMLKRNVEVKELLTHYINNEKKKKGHSKN